MNEIIKKNGIQYGLYIGLITILLTVIVYVIDLSLLGWVNGLSFLIIIVLSCILISKTKKQLKGVITFKEAFTTFFIATIVSVVISMAFSYILFKIVDPEANEYLKEITIKSTVEMLEKFGTPSSEIDKAVEKIEKTDNFSIGSILQGTVIAILIYSVIGLILAAIFKTPNAKQQ